MYASNYDWDAWHDKDPYYSLTTTVFESNNNFSLCVDSSIYCKCWSLHTGFKTYYPHQLQHFRNRFFNRSIIKKREKVCKTYQRWPIHLKLHKPYFFLSRGFYLYLLRNFPRTINIWESIIFYLTEKFS